MLESATATTTQILADLHDAQNSSAWGQLDSRYRPILRRLAVRFNLSGDDAEEFAQQTLVEFSRAYREGQYERERGRLRAWLIGIARNVGRTLRRRRGNAELDGDSRLAALPDEHELTTLWDEGREQAIFAEAMRVLRGSRLEPQTMQAFEQYALQGRAVEEVAAACAMTVDHVYVVKNRLTRRLREIVAELTRAFEEGE